MSSDRAFEKIRRGLLAALDHIEGRRQLNVREVVVPDAPEPMTPEEIAHLRRDILGVSQAVFAKIVNTAVQTVQAWEQGKNRPSGVALRHLRTIEKHPELVGELTAAG